MKKEKLQLEIKKSSIKIIKLTALLGVREGYLLARNLYGIVEHPFLTFGRILKERDLSQGILIFGLPAGLWLGWIFVLLVSRIFILSGSEKQAPLIFGRLQFGILAKASFLTSTLFTSFCVLFIAYCFYTVWRRKRRRD